MRKLLRRNRSPVKEVMQSLMGAAIFRWQSLAKWQQEGTARAEIFQISVLLFSLNSTPLTIISFCSNAHVSCAQKFQNNLHAEHTFILRTPARLCSSVRGSVPVWPCDLIIVIFSARTSRFSQLLSSSTHSFYFILHDFPPTTIARVRARLARETTWEINTGERNI